MSIKKYNIFSSDPQGYWEAEEDDDGTFMYSSDCAKLQARVEKLEAALAGLLSRVQNDRDAKNWFVEEQKVARDVLGER